MTEVILIAAAFFSSIVSGMIGMAGGMLLLVIMSTFFTPATLIPLHGAVQLASNGSRSFYLRQHLNWSIIGIFAIGTFLGAAAGSQMIVDIPEPQYRMALGVFILLLTWMPKFNVEKKIKGKFFWLGSATGFISLFAGATGPFLAPFFLRENLNKEQLVGTKAACQILTHTAKMIVFAAIGFSFGPYWQLLLGMIIAVFAGNYIGKMLLGKLKQDQFVWIFKFVISALAIRLLWLGVSAVAAPDYTSVQPHKNSVQHSKPINVIDKLPDDSGKHKTPYSK